MTTLRLGVALLLLAACGGRAAPAPVGTPVHVEGNRADLSRLAGEWRGEFHDEHTGRGGTIAFSLRAGRDTALGQVVLEAPPGPSVSGDPVSAATRGKVEGTIALTLARVGVDDGSVGGWLAPYRDPERGCWTDTWFEGTLTAGNERIDGMFFSHPTDSAAVRTGTWWAERRR
jgi:hypothetical protein